MHFNIKFSIRARAYINLIYRLIVVEQLAGSVTMAHACTSESVPNFVLDYSTSVLVKFTRVITPNVGTR